MAIKTNVGCLVKTTDILAGEWEGKTHLQKDHRLKVFAQQSAMLSCFQSEER